MAEVLNSRSERAQAKNKILRRQYQAYYALGYRSDLIITHLAAEHLIAKWTVRDKLGSVIDLQRSTEVTCDLSTVSIDH
ncbi:hypothetical protein [Phaeocystidibacter marisrubri]|uniref:Uncharacterized protein n=1 Tax=Phaeocystidibacter marisrubri TaxID=1577780 RepID=A0A6L3ZGS8_9FLAO|nr:hypothetical protein [Phaeocystidibacter marisrubri]KAB2816823.1 hypothetical protein F8C82_00035 [Phaeocystidibacter marisrubri]GGH78001.1 hypothetical protein GCM10011318_28620 [Phaeocystidibacter marisrubri]